MSTKGSRLLRAGPMRPPRALVLVLVLMAALAAVNAAASSGYAITRYSFTGGGALSAAGAYRLTGSAGQPLAGAVSAGGTSLGSGFWAPAVSRSNYLPLVRR